MKLIQKENFKGKTTADFEILPEAYQPHLPKDTRAEEEDFM